MQTRVNGIVGERVENAAARAIGEAHRQRECVLLVLNNTEVKVGPNSTPEEVVNDYLMKRKGISKEA